MKFHAEKVTLPGAVLVVAWVVVDELYRMHVEATTYLESVRGRHCSVNTQRVYASRVALYLTWCDERGLDWSSPGFENLLRFRDWLISEPLPPRGKRPPARPRFRREGSGDAVLGTMTEFLCFGVGHGWTAAELAVTLSRPKHLRFLAPGQSAGEGGQFREVQSRTLKLRGDDPGIEFFTAEQVDLLIRLARTARDRFLIVLMRATGMRIGETLGCTARICTCCPTPGVWIL
ncbi:hypothetical protein [Streptomyces rimosus]|uniref:hypothetical protein n=1 Tax=Streptomyces rimosus TaxID=1927 RepID=UPI00067C86B6|nr:hypothetical protein [Streptomyces rimosus]